MQVCALFVKYDAIPHLEEADSNYSIKQQLLSLQVLPQGCFEQGCRPLSLFHLHRTNATSCSASSLMAATPNYTQLATNSENVD